MVVFSKYLFLFTSHISREISVSLNTTEGNKNKKEKHPCQKTMLSTIKHPMELELRLTTVGT